MLLATLYWKGHSIVKSYLLASGNSVSQIGKGCMGRKKVKEINLYPPYEGKKKKHFINSEIFYRVPKMTSKETQVLFQKLVWR